MVLLVFLAVTFFTPSGLLVVLGQGYLPNRIGIASGGDAGPGGECGRHGCSRPWRAGRPAGRRVCNAGRGSGLGGCRAPFPLAATIPATPQPATRCERLRRKPTADASSLRIVMRLAVFSSPPTYLW